MKKLKDLNEEFSKELGKAISKVQFKYAYLGKLFVVGFNWHEIKVDKNKWKKLK